MKKLRSCDTPLAVMHHLPMEYPGLPMKWSWADGAKLQAVVLQEAILDVLDGRVTHHEKIWRWIVTRRETLFVFSACAEAFDRICTDEAYRKYSARLLAAAVSTLHEGKVTRRMTVLIWHWVKDDGEYPFSFKACCVAYGADADIIREQIWKMVCVAMRRKDGVARAA